jgi:hypothetical protein
MQRLRSQTRRQARAAYRYGRAHDRRFARSFLLELRRRVPDDPLVLACLAALALPESVAKQLVWGARLVRRGVSRRG